MNPRSAGTEPPRCQMVAAGLSRRANMWQIRIAERVMHEIRGACRLSRLARFRLAAICGVVIGMFAAAPLWAQAPQPAAPVQPADALRSRIVLALAEQRYDAVLEGMATYRTLEAEGVVIPVSLVFAESEAAQALRDWPRAYMALGEYLARADPTDPSTPTPCADSPASRPRPEKWPRPGSARSKLPRRRN